jgi:integrase
MSVLNINFLEEESLFEKLQCDKTIDYNTPNPNTVVTRNLDNKDLSYFKDNIWDFTSYASNANNMYIIDFEKRIPKSYIYETKKIILLILSYGKGRSGASLSLETLIRSYFNDGLIPIIEFCNKKNITLKNFLEKPKIIKSFTFTIDRTSSRKLGGFVFISTLFDRIERKLLGYKYELDQELMNDLKQTYLNLKKNRNQTPVIPSRILHEYIKLLWGKMDELENNIDNFVNLIKEKLIINTVEERNKISLKELFEKHDLKELFEKYSGRGCGSTVSKIITIYQSVCKNLIHIYSGMRSHEALSLKLNCFEKKNIGSGQRIVRLIGISTKFSGTKKTEKWITSHEIERVINLMGKISEAITQHYNYNNNNEIAPLFISSEWTSKYRQSIKTVANVNTLSKYSNYENILFQITEEDILELEDIDPFRDWRNEEEFKIGNYWNFKSHQFRRSLAVYSIRSGFVTLGGLKKQLKHIFIEMSIYYTKGVSRSKDLLSLSPSRDHIINLIDEEKYEYDALQYTKDIILSDEDLFGAFGKFAEKNICQHKIQDKKNFVLQNRDKTIKMFKNGEIAFKNTPLGGCVAIEECDKRLAKSFIECFSCAGGVIKKSKVDTVIHSQKEFIKTLNNKSVEYRTEVNDLKILEEMREKLNKKDA